MLKFQNKFLNCLVDILVLTYNLLQIKGFYEIGIPIPKLVHSPVLKVRGDWKSNPHATVLQNRIVICQSSRKTTVFFSKKHYHLGPQALVHHFSMSSFHDKFAYDTSLFHYLCSKK